MVVLASPLGPFERTSTSTDLRTKGAAPESPTDRIQPGLASTLGRLIEILSHTVDKTKTKRRFLAGQTDRFGIVFGKLGAQHLAQGLCDLQCARHFWSICH